MAITLTELAILLTGDSSRLDKDLADAGGKTKSWAGALGGSISKLVGGVVLGGVGAAAGAIVGIGAAALDVSRDTRNAAADIEGSFGLATEAAQEFADIGRSVFGNNFANDIGEATNTVALLNQQLKVTDSAELQRAAERAFALRDSFDADLNDSIDSAAVLMDELGLSSDQAFDFIARGFQRGLNRSGDFTDTIREYGNQFGAAGFSAEEFFSILETGSAGGVLGTDKIADAIKEMNIRLAEGGKPVQEAFSAIGLNFEEIAGFIASGDETWADYFDNIVAGINGIDDPMKRAQVQVAIFGTQAEDLGVQFTEGLSAATTSLGDLEGAADSLNKRYETLGDFFTGLWRRTAVAVSPVTDSLLDMANAALPHLEAGFKVFEDNVLPVLETTGGLIQALTNSITSLFGGELLDASEFGLTGALADFVDGFNAVIGVLTGGGLEGGIDDALGSLGIFKEWFDKNLPLIRQTVQTVLNAISGFWESHGASVLSVVGAAFDNIYTVIDTVLRNILDAVTLVLQVINGDWEGASATLEGMVTRTWEAIKSVFNTSLGALRTIVTEFVPVLVQLFRDGWQLVFDTFQAIDWGNVGFTVVTAILNGLSTLGRALKKLAGDGAKEFKNYDWGSLAKSIITGLVRGIKNGSIDVLTAMTDLAGGAYDAFLTWWRSKSPSKKAEEELGPPIPQGIARGIANATGVVVAAAQEMAQAIYDELRAFDLFEALSGDIEAVLRSFVEIGAIAPQAIVGQVATLRVAISQAVAEFGEVGAISQATLETIGAAAGPARDAIVNLVEAFFGFEAATDAVGQAEDALADLAERQRQEVAQVHDLLAAVDAEIEAVLARQARDTGILDQARSTYDDLIERLEMERDAILAGLQIEAEAVTAARDALLAHQEATLSPLESQLRAIQRSSDQIATGRRIAELTAIVAIVEGGEAGSPEDALRAELAGVEARQRETGLDEETRRQLAERASLLRLQVAEFQRTREEQEATRKAQEQELARLELEELKLQEQIDLVRERQALELDTAQSRVDAVEEQIRATELHHNRQIEFWQAQIEVANRTAREQAERYEAELAALRAKEERFEAHLELVERLQADALADAQAQVIEAQKYADAAADILAVQQAIAKEYQAQNALLAEQLRIEQEIAEKKGIENPVIDLSPLSGLLQQILDTLRTPAQQQVGAASVGRTSIAIQAAGSVDGVLQALRQAGMTA